MKMNISEKKISINETPPCLYLSIQSLIQANKNVNRGNQYRKLLKQVSSEARRSSPSFSLAWIM